MTESGEHDARHAAERDPAHSAEPEPEPRAAPAPGALSDEDLAAVRALIVAAHPEIVPEMVRGTTIGEMTASIEAATAAFQRAAETARRREREGRSQAAPAVPAGGAAAAIDPDRLPAVEKMRRGLAGRG